MNKLQIALLTVIVLAVVAYMMAGGEKGLNPAVYHSYAQQTPVLSAVIFSLLLIFSTALSLPVTGVASVIAGIIFNHSVGTALVVFSCSAGGTLAFLASRFIFHDLIQQRFTKQLAVINAGLHKDGAFYVFGLRMVPVVPFWLLNLLVGITSMSIGRFFFATCTGMLPITIILVHFGTELGAVERFSLNTMLSPSLLLSLCLLGLLPFITKGLLRLAQRYRRARQ